MRPTETNRLFNRVLLGGVLLVASVITNASCNIFERYERKPAPDVITVPDKMVPDHLDQGEPAPYPGWLFSEPLFNEYAPHWQKGPYVEEEK